MDKQKCSSAASESFSRHVTGQLFRVNALLLVNTILMGVIVMASLGPLRTLTVMVGIGAYCHRYHHRPLTCYIFLGATALFIPIISYVLSTIGNQNGVILFSTTLVVVSDPREGRNISPSVVLLVQEIPPTIWTSYLMVYNILSMYRESSITLGATNLMDCIKWPLVYVHSLVGLMIIPPFALTFAKLLFMCFAWCKTRKSLAIGCNPRLIVGYMEQLQDADLTNDDQDIPPPLIPHGYSFTLNHNTGGLVTLDKVWQLDDMHDIKLTSQLKDVCLSFALSKLLRCRFARYTNAEIGFTNASNFLQHLLLEDSNDEILLRLIEDELSFLRDFYYSFLAISYSKSWMPILSILISLSGIGYCLVLSIVIVYGKTDYLSDGKVPLIRCNYQCRQFIGEAQGEILAVQHQFFGSAIFDLVPVVVLLALVVLAEIREIASYTCSNWTKVALICSNINHASWHKSCIMQKCIRHVLQCRCKILNHLEDKMDQCSILVLHPRKTPMGLLRHLKPGQKVKVPREVKATIMNTLRSYERSRDNNRMPSLCTRPQLKTSDSLLWVVDGTKGIAFWSRGSCQPPSDHKTAAIHLSRYCAYLVAYSPELLPEDDEWCKSLYKTVKKKAEHILAGVSTAEVEYQQLVELMSASQNHEVLKDGAKLGQQ
ncbi:hypothetical protein VPH35_041511 [Triticum aestivum]